MNRKAKCACGNLQIELGGDPNKVVVCNCFDCQKRTGSVFGVSAYFDDKQIAGKSGEKKTFRRIGDAGRAINATFCPNCGTTVYWEAEFLPNKIGVAVGCFEDPQFPAPVASAWTRSKHEWVTYPPNCRTSPTQDFAKNA